jgi:hypothetical protein
MRSQTAPFFVLWLCIGMSAVMISSAQSAWVADGVAISPDASNYKPFIISDGASGSIIAWHGGAGSDIFARRLRSDGSSAPGWPATGPLVVCGANGLQEQPVLVTDLAGGALIFWQDARNGASYDIFGQHISSTGQVASTANSNWVADGIPVSTAAGNQYLPVAVSDGAGGAIVVWQDGRHGTGNYDIYAQRVDGDGNLLWVPAGIPVCVAGNNQINPTIVADGAGGAYVAWQDYRKGSEFDIYLQHLTADGTAFPDPRWTTSGVGACVAANSQFYPALAGDGAGGVYVAWQDFRTGTDNHIFAQHLSAEGVVATNWPVDGSPVCQAQYSQYYPVVAGDGATGVFIAWQDYRSGTTNHIYAQHLTARNGGWAADGVPISTAINGQFAPQIANDGRGGAFITWYDSRNGATNDVYFQQVDDRGVLSPLWDRDGLGVCLAPNTQQFPVLATSSAGTAIMTWQDLRSGSLATAAIYAQQAVSAPTVGVDEPRVVGAQLGAARPNPFRGTSELQLTLTEPAFVRAEVLDITGRRVATLASRTFPAGVHELSWDGNSARGERAAPGVYLVRVQSPGFEKTQRVVRLR